MSKEYRYLDSIDEAYYLTRGGNPILQG